MSRSARPSLQDYSKAMTEALRTSLQQKSSERKSGMHGVLAFCGSTIDRLYRSRCLGWLDSKIFLSLFLSRLLALSLTEIQIQQRPIEERLFAIWRISRPNYEARTKAADSTS